MPSPVSPCIGLCTLDALQICRGCYRHIGEIARWGSMTDAERFAVLDEVARRAPQAQTASTDTTAHSKFTEVTKRGCE